MAAARPLLQTGAFPLTVEAPLIGLEKRVLLKHYLKQGLAHVAIARAVGISRRTVIRMVQRGDLDRDLDHPPRYGPRPPRPSKLDPYKEIIVQRLKDYPELSAVRLLEEVQAAGYNGGYSQLCVHVRTVRPRPAPEPPNVSGRLRVGGRGAAPPLGAGALIEVEVRDGFGSGRIGGGRRTGSGSVRS